MDQLLQSFFVPLFSIRTRRKGYAVAMIKSGLRAIGWPDLGPVRAPLENLSAADEADLSVLIAAGGPATRNCHRAAGGRNVVHEAVEVGEADGDLRSRTRNM